MWSSLQIITYSACVCVMSWHTSSLLAGHCQRFTAWARVPQRWVIFWQASAIPPVATSILLFLQASHTCSTSSGSAQTSPTLSCTWECKLANSPAWRVITESLLPCSFSYLMNPRPPETSKVWELELNKKYCPIENQTSYTNHFSSLWHGNCRTANLVCGLCLLATCPFLPVVLGGHVWKLILRSEKVGVQGVSALPVCQLVEIATDYKRLLEITRIY